MKKVLTLIQILILVGSCFAQIKPIDLAKQILSNPESNGNSEFYGKGFKTKFNFKTLKSDYNLSYKNFPIQKNYEIVSITAKDNSNNGFNFYLYFTIKDANWKIFSIKSYNNNIEKSYLQSLTDLNKMQVDSIIASKGDRKLFQSKEQFNYMKSVYSLALDFDDNIIKYFKQNKNQFNSLKRKFNQFKTENPNYKDFEKNSFFSNNYYSGLSISKITEYFSGLNNCLTFLISENGYNSVGYFYTNDKSFIPPVDPNKIIFIQNLSEGWYMFRAT